MKTSFHKILGLSVLILSSVCGLQAQSARTGYFMEGYSYRYMANPAFAPTHGFVSIPVLGNAMVSANSNTGLNKFMFPGNDGRLMTFLHPDVSSDQFLGGLKDVSRMGQSFHAGIINVGLYFGRSFFTLGVNLHEDVFMNIPKEMFAFLKQGMNCSSVSYNVAGFNLNANAYLDIALGGSTDIFDNLRVGGRLKLLLGAASADVNVNKMDIAMSEDSWKINSEIEGVLYGEGFNLEFEDTPPFYVKGLGQFSKFGVAGTGLAVDLGATYSPFEYMTISLAVTDLGFMTWKKSAASKLQSKGEVTVNGLSNLTKKDFEEGSTTVDDYFKKIGEDLETMYKFNEVDVTEDGKGKLHTTITAGLEYGFLENRLSAGLLYNNIANPCGANVNDFTMSANLRFIKAVQFSASYSFSNYGHGFGAALGIGEVLFLAIDNYSPYISRQGVPLRETSPAVTIGLNVPLNKKDLSKRTPGTLGYFGSLLK